MAKINSLNNKTPDLTIDPGASGDSFVQFDINATGEFRIGCDDTDSDAFIISQGSALGTSNTFRMSATGERTLPLQPSFVGSINAANNVTGDGTAAALGAVTAMTEVVDRNGDFNPGNGAGTGASFTAPITGLYYLSYNMGMNTDVTNGGTQCSAYINTSNRVYITANYPTKRQLANFAGASGKITTGGGFICDMDASDTAQYIFYSQTGTKVDDVVDGQVGGGLMG